MYLNRYFIEKNVNYIILEVGIGGRYDSTNILEYNDVAELVCVITNVSLDHQNILGNNIIALYICICIHYNRYLYIYILGNNIIN